MSASDITRSLSVDDGILHLHLHLHRRGTKIVLSQRAECGERERIAAQQTYVYNVCLGFALHSFHRNTHLQFTTANDADRFSETEDEEVESEVMSTGKDEWNEDLAVDLSDGELEDGPNIVYDLVRRLAGTTVEAEAGFEDITSRRAARGGSIT
ncbi:uncharacterized protein EKO05_0004294 [Ascochyta rabiei]|uniref:uncharacterized protein n=1 Tax=Didymella rabiei TaxID=5454 RepID=UPI002207492E|nr:uncharacterized protein EKO05_0004294 [Ascochyta rabiei]UPX13795.1 hypothetical protein EKO05_0004294 [Ascochyta rabiei]